MDEIFRCLCVTCQFQQEVVRLLSCSIYQHRKFVDADEFRMKLIEILPEDGYGASIKKINTAIDALVNQNLLVRRLKSGKHQIGLNKEIWDLSPDTIELIQLLTTSITKYMQDDQYLLQVAKDVALLFSKFNYSSGKISDSTIYILVVRFHLLPIEPPGKQFICARCRTAVLAL